MSIDKSNAFKAINDLFVYDVGEDKIVPLTQKWVDDVSHAVQIIAMQRGIARDVLSYSAINDAEKIWTLRHVMQVISNPVLCARIKDFTMKLPPYAAPPDQSEN